MSLVTTLEGEQRAILEEYVNIYKEILEDKEPRQLLLNVDGMEGNSGLLFRLPLFGRAA